MALNADVALASLRGPNAVASVRRLGPASIDGAASTQYVVTFAPFRVCAPHQPPAFVTQRPTDIWVGSAGRLLQVRSTSYFSGRLPRDEKLPAAFGVFPQAPMTTVATLTFAAFGSPVHVVAPPASALAPRGESSFALGDGSSSRLPFLTDALLLPPVPRSAARSSNPAHKVHVTPRHRAGGRDMTVTLVTGANKGLGYETARRLLAQGHTVYVGARNAELGEAAASELGGQFVQLDVTADESVEAALGLIDEREGRLDVLVNNAGISATGEVTGPVALRVFDTNAVGLIRVTQAALPLLEKSENPVVVNVSSALGSFWAVTNPERRQFHFPSIIYGASKAAVSMLTVQYAKTFPEIKFNAVEPGFTATDLTPFSGAGQPVETGAEVIVRMATIGKDGPSGTFHENEDELAW